MIASSREIVNGSMMPQYTGKKVSVTGLVTKINPNGLTFDVRAMDDVEIKVNLKRPNNDILEGLVQVNGSAQGKTLICDEVIQFSKGNQEFDAASHNALCGLLQSVPDLWATS